ncbi:MAG TPA: flagellar protein FlgN [Psychromonas hadalis]|nr:flagellar protein FlgN [Psychromonas hadalis]
MTEEQLNQQLAEQLTALDNLAKILDAGSTCLKEKVFDTLNEILFNKQKNLQAIMERDKQLTSPDNIAAITQSENLSSLKKQIDDSLQACHKSNQINGRLIELSRKKQCYL